jgi:hypothetical protein
VPKAPNVGRDEHRGDEEAHQRMRRALDDIPRMPLAVAHEAITGRAELHGDRRNQDQPDELVQREQRAQEEDRHAFDRLEHEQYNSLSRGRGCLSEAVVRRAEVPGKHVCPG